MFKKIICLLFGLLVITSCNTSPYNMDKEIVLTNSLNTEEIVITEIISIYDGDTFKVNIPDIPKVFGDRISIRLYGIDTPELSSKSKKIKLLAIKAKEYTSNRLLNAHKITLKNIQRDKYFRLLAVVDIDGVNLNQELLDHELAKPYFGDNKTDLWK